ncbi:hypothetical protein [Sphingopyxis sp.]|uniref:hypothetical protein n=1 Tax=Sphingopyxis sp. TaxID=1908224 RepID=UPI002ED97F13
MQRRWTRRDARALRFLFVCIGSWTVLRAMMVWNPAIPQPPAGTQAPWSAPSPFTASAVSLRLKLRTGESATTQRQAGLSPAFPALWHSEARHLAGVTTAKEPDAAFAGGLGADRHSLRLALMARLLPPLPGGAARSAVAADAPMWFASPPAAQAAPGQGKPFWIRRQLAGWSLGGWLYLRDGDGAAPDGIAAAGQLGGSQAGFRLGYGFGDSGRVRAYGRATMAVRQPEQREIALGLAFAPFVHAPVDIAVERRVALGKDGRNALAAMISGGVGDVTMPGGFRLEAYGQAGVVGARRRDGFVDGAVVIDRRIGTDETASLRLGALAAGAAQPGAARVDVGPRLTLRLPHLGEGSRIALDWRQRVAGDARPESGLALTLATDF